MSGTRLALRTAAVLLAGGLSLVAGAQSGGGLEVRAFLQPGGSITETQSVQLVIEIQGDSRGTEVSTSGLGRLTNLQVVAGPSTRFNSRWSNGRWSAKSQLVYTLVPRAAGPAMVPELKVSIGGRTYTTDPIRLEVKPAPSGVPPRSGGGPGGRTGAGDGADLFLRAVLGKEEAWVGEAISLSVLLYTTERFAGNPSLADDPSLSSFWVEDIEVDPRDKFNTKVDGRVYLAAPLIHKIIVPQTSGELEIGRFVMQIPVRLRSTGDPFESFFSFNRTKPVVRKTQPLKLKVRSLPSAGRMDDFSGAVGVFTLKVGLDRAEAGVNDAVALTATVEGEGFLRAVGAPVLDPPPDLKVFDPKVSASSRTVRGKLVSRKTWEWVLIPLTTGEMQIPPVRFQYFDSNSGSYKLASKELARLVVHQGDRLPDTPLARGDIRLQHRDLAFIKPLRGTLKERVPRAHERTLFLAALLSPLAWAPLFVWAGRHRARLQRNLGLARSRKARSRARQRLRSAGRRIDSTDSAVFHEEVARALVEYVGDRFDRAAAGLTYEVANDLLTGRGVQEPLRQRFRACLEACDFARFVPSSSAPERRNEVLEEAGRLIDELERSL